MTEPDYSQGLDEILNGFSDASQEVCSVLDYNVGAFRRDFDFLSILLDDLSSGRSLEWKFDKGHITKEGMQAAITALKKLPNIPYVLLIISEMRKLLERVGIEEVEMSEPELPKTGDNILVQLTNGEMITSIREVRDGFAYFCDTETKRIRVTNLRFTRNLQIGGVTGVQVGEGWMIRDSGKTETIDLEKP